MVDIATLGLKVDATDVERATAALNRFTRSGGESERAAAGMVKALQGGSQPVRQFKESFAALDKIQDLLPASANKVVDSLTAQATKASSTARQWAQLTAVQQAGVPIGSAAANAIAQLAGAAHDLAEKGDAVDQKVTGANGFLGKMTNKLIGVSAAVLVLHRVVAALEDIAKQMPETASAAERLGVSFQRFSGLTDIAKSSGVSTKEMTENMLKFGGATDDAQQGLGSIAMLLRANGMAVGDWQKNLVSVAELVERAGGNLGKVNSILAQAGLPNTRQWLDLLHQIAVTHGQVLDAAEKTSKATEEEKVRIQEIDRQWNEMWATFESVGKQALLGIANAINTTFASGSGSAPSTFVENTRRELLGIANWIRGQMGKEAITGVTPEAIPLPMARPAEAGAGTPQKGGMPVDPVQQAKILTLEAQRIGMLGSLATVQEKVRAKTLELNAAQLQGATISKADVDAIKRMTETQEESARVAARTTLGVTNAEELRSQKERDLSILIANGTITQEQMNTVMGAYERHIRDVIDAQTVQNSTFPDLARFQVDAQRLDKQLDMLAVSGLNSASTAIADFAMGTKTAQDAFKSFADQVLRSIIEMVVKMTVLAPIAKALQTTLSGFIGGGGSAVVPTGHAGAEIGFGQSGSRMVDPRMFVGAPRFHPGGMLGLRPGEVPFIGMRGEEVGWPAQLAQKYGGGGGGVNVTVINNAGAEVNTNTRERSNGIIDLEVVIDKAVAKNLITPGRDSNRALGTAGTLLRR